MKNHWLKLHEQKKKRFWTVEFSKNSTSVLKPRRADVLDARFLGYMGSTSGKVEINFKGGMTNANDVEFIDFLRECRRSMKDWLCRLHLYANLSSSGLLEYYELTSLSYGTIGVGIGTEDMKVQVKYNGLKHYHIA
jgi:hypothetical protein